MVQLKPYHYLKDVLTGASEIDNCTLALGRLPVRIGAPPMKINSSQHSAFIKPRLLLALSLCIIGAVFASSALTSFGKPKTDSEIKTIAAKKKHSGRRAMASKQTDRPGVNKDANGGGAKAPDQSTLDNSFVPRVTEQRNKDGQIVYSVSPSKFDISAPLSEMAKTKISQAATEDREHEELELPSWLVLRSGRPDPVTQVVPSATAERSPSLTPPTIGFNFAGVIGTGGYPSDENGSAGNDQYVETVNTRYQVWSLDRMTNTPTSILGPVNINTLWSGFGGACQTLNNGDPVVLFDKVANRWLISQFTSSAVSGVYYQCVAISTTADATGTYARYAFAVPDSRFGDYPHYGVWTDAYYVMAHEFTSPSGGSYVGALFGAMDRTKMVAGDPTATWQVIVDPAEGGQMPADLDGFAPPPGGAPGIFLSVHGAGMYIYRMKVDFTTPANTTRPLQAIVPIAAAASACGGGDCIPQPGSAVVLPALSDRLMFRAAYRNYVDHESLVISHSVDPSITGVVSGVRWYEFRLSGQPDAVCSTYPCVYQQGTVADVPGGRSRWMPSIAMDSAQNMLVGYSATGTANGTDNHSTRYTGRVKDDPLGTMTVPEAIIVTGTRNETGTTRWGDYTSMSVDPADDCTFWYVDQHYVTATSGNGTWRTQIASSRFPEGTGPGQCEGDTCTSRPASAPTIGGASAIADNQIQITWSGIAPTPGSYAIERAIGTPGSEGLYQPVAFVAGAVTNFTDTTVQGGVTYTYRVIAATDAKGRCQSLVRSGTASATATGSCNLKPTFAGASAATSANTPMCGVTLSWTAASTSCPLSSVISYNIYRGTTPDFVPSGANRIATCVPGPTSYTDTNSIVSGNTYYYTVRAEDNTTGNGGPCGGGNEETNTIVVAGTAYGTGTQGTPGTWTDAGGDGTAFLRLNPGSNDQVWRFVKTADDAGANHTPGGAYAYRNAGPSSTAVYAANSCASAETPDLTVGATSVNLTYWERHQIEKGWDGVAVEYSRNGGAWTIMTTPSNLPADGCEVTDVVTDWAAISCTGAPPANACGDAATVPMINGPIASGTSCSNWVTGALTAYGRRCHTLTGLVSGDTIKFRWRFTSDSAAEFAGFYLDDIAVTNILLPNPCTGVQAPAAVSAQSIITHGGHTGTFGVDLPLATRGIEPRVGAGGNYTIVMHFDQPVNGGSATLTGIGSAGTATFSGSDMTIPLTGVADRQTVTLTVHNVTNPSGGSLSMASIDIGFLAGDVNGSGIVNASDVASVKSNSGLPVTGANFRNDIVVNGSINAADVSKVKSQSGASLP